MAYHSPWDLYYWLVQTFAGSETIFIAIALIFIAAMAGMFRMTGEVTLIMFGLFVMMFSAMTGNYILLVVVAISFLAWGIIRMFK